MKKILILSIIIVLIFSSISIGNDELKIQQRELEKLQDQLSNVNNEIDVKEGKKSELINEIDKTQDKIKQLDGEISNLENRIIKTKSDINNTKNELVISENNLKSNQELLNERLRIIYKSRQIGYIEVLLGAEDFEDLLSRIDMVQKIYLHDKNLIEEIKAQIETIKKTKEKLEEQKIELETAKDSLEEKKQNLLAVHNELSRKQNELKNNIDALEALEDKLLKDAEQVKEIIKNLKLQQQYVGGVMTWPSPNHYTITSYYGYRIHPIYHTKKLHTGLDIAVPWGEDIVAAQQGTVIYSNWLGGYGKAVMIDHGGGYVTLYGHNSSLAVKVGQRVQKGQVISKCGTTGVSTGAHLHFEVMINGEHVDPMKYLKN